MRNLLRDSERRWSAISCNCAELMGAGAVDERTFPVRFRLAEVAVSPVEVDGCVF